MQHLIKVTKGGRSIDQFSPKGHPLSCFYDQVMQHLVKHPDDVIHYEISGGHFTYKTDCWQKALNFLNLDEFGAVADQITARPSWMPNNHYVTLIALTE
jgi:hypothetical protein